MIKNKEHLTMTGLRKIVSLRASLNTGLTPLLKEHFPDVIPSAKPNFALPSSFSPKGRRPKGLTAFPDY